MSLLLSFLGGAAEGVSTEIEKAEKSAKEDALLRVKGLAENYKETMKANRELQNSMNAEKDWIKSTYTDATPEQVAFLLGSPASLEALKKMKDPTKVSLNDVIAISTNNESNAVAAQRITALPEVADVVGSKIKQAMPQYRSGLGGVFDRIGESAGDTAAKQYARATGVDLETLQSTKRLERPTQAGTFNMAAVKAEVPDSMADIVKAAEVKRFQAGQKFGKNSDQYKAADAEFTAASNEIVMADKKLEDRRDRLEIQRQDSKGDPILTAALTKEIDGLNADIKARREATSTKREREGTGEDKITYAKAKTRIEDYMNTDMIANKGLGWRKYVEEKVVTDPATGKTITIPGKKVNLTPEQEKEYIDGMNQARMQGLKDLGLVTEKGQPVNNEVKSLMTAYGFGRPAAPAQPAPSTPAAIPTAQPTTTPAQTTKPVNRPKPADAPPDAKLAPDGHWYSQDKKTGKYIKWSN